MPGAAIAERIIDQGVMEGLTPDQDLESLANSRYSRRDFLNTSAVFIAALESTGLLPKGFLPENEKTSFIEAMWLGDKLQLKTHTTTV